MFNRLLVFFYLGAFVLLSS